MRARQREPDPMKRTIALLAAVILMATAVPALAANLTQPLAVSQRLDREARQAPSANDPGICSGRVALYIYDNINFTYDANHPVKRFCGGSGTNQILVPNLGNYSCLPYDSCNNIASSVRARNMTGRTARFYQGVSYQGHIVTCYANCDIPRIGDYGTGSNNNLSSMYAI
jgi:hypothetical protein